MPDAHSSSFIIIVHSYCWTSKARAETSQAFQLFSRCKRFLHVDLTCGVNLQPTDTRNFQGRKGYNILQSSGLELVAVSVSWIKRI